MTSHHLSRRDCLLGGLLTLAGGIAAAQTWPSKPVTFLVAGPGGGSADIVARLMADALARELGQPVVVEPKPGAAGAIAIAGLLQAPRDGHTFLVGVNSLVSEIPHIVKMRWDMTKVMQPVAELSRGGLVLVANPSVPARNLAELIAYAKAHRGELSYASYSPGTLSHVLGLLLNQAAGIDLLHVGYKGSTPALADVMGNHVPLMFDGMATSLPLIRAGKIKALAISAPARTALLPDVPTFRELGYPELEALAWLGLWSTTDAPAAAQSRVRQASLKALAEPALRSRMLETGFEPGLPRSTAEMAQALKADYERVGAVLTSIGFTPS